MSKLTDFQKHKSTVWVGIDPGATGAIAVLQANNLTITTLKDEREALDELRRISKLPGQVFVLLEEVHSMPRQGVVSSFTFGRNFGVVIGMVMACDLSLQLMRPQRWLKELGIRPRKKTESKTEWKKFLAATAKRMYPKFQSINQQNADSVLIATACRRLFNVKD